MQVRIVDAGSLDIDRHILLLNRSFGQSAWAAQIGTTLTREFYIWKYFSPAGEAVISSVLTEGEVASSVSALPTLFQTPSGVKKGWQIADIATLPSARRRGLYRSCLSGLVERLADQMLVCFPNANSRKEIERQGFSYATDVRTFVRPLNPFAGRPAVTSSANDPATFEKSGSAGRRDTYSFFRNRDFLQWRYRTNPACRYDVISSDGGYCVLRSFDLFGSAVGIVMEIAADTERAAGELMRETERMAAGKGMRANFIMTSTPLVRGLRSRYLPLPRMLLPKRQALFVRTSGAMAPSASWDIQIGDWDGL
jgi:ribosomal protein S18 acetylase RimI-like enzyme